MTRRRLILLLFAVIAAGTVLFVMVQPSEPVYKGKKLSAWIYLSQVGRSEETVGHLRRMVRNEEADSAIRDIGTNLFPIILKMLGPTDGKFKTKIINLVNGQSIVKFHLYSADEKADAAVNAVAVLGETAKLLAPSIAQLGTNSNAMVRVHALRALLPLIYADREWVRNQDALDHLVKSSYFRDPDVQVKRAASLPFNLLHPPHD